MHPDYQAMHTWENYSADILVEYRQSLEEGKEIAGYSDLFRAVSAMPMDEQRVRMADVLSDIVRHAPQRADYPYVEPSLLEEIRAARPAGPHRKIAVEKDEALQDKVLGAWLGRICGCLLGKPVEGIRTEDFHPFLQKTGNWPLHRYITTVDAMGFQADSFAIHSNALADSIPCAPVDDDTNYMVLAQVLVEKYGRSFSPRNVGQIWLDFQPKSAYCTAERVAFCNLVKGYLPPDSAAFQNPYREWIGAQIRGDYFGYIHPGDPEGAAEMAWRDASISHVKNGIYGEMLIAAMIAYAAAHSDIEAIVRAGLNEIPEKSRLYEAVLSVLQGWAGGVSQEACFRRIHTLWDEHIGHDWCHTIPNAMIVAAALLYGKGEFGPSICMAVQTGFDTDCNGATVGSILGMRGGSSCIGSEWTAPLRGMLDTSIFGVGRVRIAEMATRTMAHMA